jgi:hypothetical protein
MSTEFSWDRPVDPHDNMRGWKIKRNKAIKAEMKRLGITNKDITGGQYDNGKITFTYKGDPKGPVTQPLPEDHWTKEKRNQPRMTNEEKAAAAFKDLDKDIERSRRRRKQGGQVKKKRKISKKKPRGWGIARYKGRK